MTNHNRRTVSRRRFLVGTGGAVLSLPWLESYAGQSNTADSGKPSRPAQRLAFFYLPNGIVRRGFLPGESDREIPKFAGQNNVWRFEGKVVPPGSHPLTLTTTLASLHKMRDRISLRSEERRVGKEGRSRWSPYH